MKPELLVAGVLVAFCGLVLILAAKAARRRRGFLPGATVSFDEVRLESKLHGLVGRPDRIVRQGGIFIPEEHKRRATKFYPSYRAQVGVYLLLIEEHYGVRPPYGVIVLGDGRRERVENTEELRAWVLDVAAKIREARRVIREEIPVSPPSSKCRRCGQRSRCRQSKA